MRALILAVAFTLTACSSFKPLSWISPYQMDIPQGNVVADDAVAKLKVGMTRSQVRFVLGTPLVADAFHSDRWDYKYRLIKNGRQTEDKLLTAYFNGDVLTRVELDGKTLPLSQIASDAAVAQKN
jgi:outer membrane protein assembly factor BamE